MKFLRILSLVKIRGCTKEMSMKNNNYTISKKRRTFSDIRKRRSRRQAMKKIIAIGSIVAIAVIAIVLLVCLHDGGENAVGENTTASIEANATASNVADGNTEKNTTEDVTTEEPTTEEPTTLPAIRYGDEMYNDGKLVVCIDPGHGGNDTGCVGVDGSYEKDDVLMLSKLIISELENRGVTVITTRTVDEWVDLADRPKYANEQNADILVSVHRNSLENDTATKGFEAWIHSDNCENSESLANMIMANLDSAGISRNRGVKKGTQGSSEENYKVNSGSAMPSVLLEMGFMSSPKDNQLYKNNAKEYAKAIADAIIQWSGGKPY